MRAPRRWPTLSLPGRSGDALLIVPGLLVAALFAVLVSSDGGVNEVDWCPAAVFVILLLAVVVAGSGRALATLPRSARIALACFGAFTVWSFLSIAWADDRGVAWDAANMTLLYFTTFALFAIWPWSPRAGMIVMGSFSVALAAIGWVIVHKSAGAFDPTVYLIKQRFADPVGYPNGNAALFLGAAFPAVLLGARLETPWAARGLLLGSAGVLVDVALLSQSRGSLLAGGMLVAVCVAVVPGRVRTIVALAAVGAITALSVPKLLDVYDVAGAGGDLGHALGAASDAAVLSFVALFGLGASAALVERYAEIPQRVVDRAGRVAGVLAILGAIAGAVVVLAAIGNPVSYAQSRWDAFKDSKPLTPQSSGVRLTASLDGRSRDEFWSVALHDWEHRPFGGMGAGNFAVVYSRERKGLEEPVDPHSLPVRVLSQTGIVGAALFLGFLIGAGAAISRVRRHPDVLRRAVAAAALVAFTYWFVHSSADWLFAIPGVAGPAFAWLGMAVALGAAPHPGARVALAADAPGPGVAPPRPMARGRVRVSRRLGIGLLVAATLAMLAAIIPPWLSASAVNDAAATWRSDPQRAFRLLHRASSLNPLTDDPDLLEGVIASRLGDRARARASFARAVEREPQNWYSRQQLGLEDALAGRHSQALWQLERARALNPLEDTTQYVLKEVRANRRPQPAEVRTELLNRVCSRVPNAGVC
ncbi:MAG TPA: O-antigen ligase family protein [Solirubrobacteraceae bacterium]